jgi:hypothetical protein
MVVMQAVACIGIGYLTTPEITLPLSGRHISEKSTLPDIQELQSPIFIMKINRQLCMRATP